LPFSLSQRNYVAFIDETGEYGLESINPRFPLFALCTLTSTVTGYLTKSEPILKELKRTFFDTDEVVLHGHKIRQKKDPFHILKKPEIMASFMESVCTSFDELDGHLIAAVIEKEKHKKQYSDPENPFFLSLKFVLERLYMHWRGVVGKNNKLFCVFEKRGKQEDARTESWFNRICAGENYKGDTFHFDCDFRDKKENLCGHQYADLAAYSIARYVESRDKKRKDWIAVEPRIRRNARTQEIEGYGLKIFP
jgi:Protein of unknown function (DUF3800)